MEPRKASDILLELEKKIDIMLNIIRTQDMNIKILSNKLNSLQEALGKVQAAPQKIVVEAISTAPPVVAPSFQPFSNVSIEHQIPVSAEFNLPLEAEPQGFRRTSRPETFSGDDIYLPSKPGAPSPTKPNNNIGAAPPGRAPQQGQPPPGRSSNPAQMDVVVPAVATQKVPPPKQQQAPTGVQNAVPVMQRVVNGHGRSLWMADVEIIDLTTMSSSKTRTNGSGKWMASLTVGQYRVIIRKFEQTTKESLESVQEITVDGTQSPYELPAIIMKSA